MKLSIRIMQLTVALYMMTGAAFLNSAHAFGSSRVSRAISQIPTAVAQIPSHLDLSIPMPDNTHLIDQDRSTGFEIYRSSKPNVAADFKKLCGYGVREMMVLDGTGSVDEAMAAKYCPGFKVIYNVDQKTKVPLTQEFLAKFDEWVVASRAAGKKIAFRCNCGCHRTGRLAAYYQMKYMGLSADQAIDEMYKYGKYMFLFPYLKPQVRALADYVAGKPCSQDKQYCVTTDPEAAALPATAPEEGDTL